MKTNRNWNQLALAGTRTRTGFQFLRKSINGIRIKTTHTQKTTNYNQRVVLKPLEPYNTSGYHLSFVINQIENVLSYL